MNISCYNSSDPFAVNATQMFDLNNDRGNLWGRQNDSVPLPSCSSSSPPPDFPCQVCLFDQVVYAVCRSLTGGVKMVMEAGEHHVRISKSDCPKPPSEDKPTSNDDHMGQLNGVHIFLIVLAIILIIIGVACAWKRWKCSKTENKQRRFNLPPNWRAETSVQVLMPDDTVNAGN